MNIKLLVALLITFLIHVDFAWTRDEIAKDELVIAVGNHNFHPPFSSIADEELFDILCKDDTILNLDNSGFASLNPEDLLEFNGPIPVDSMSLSQSEFSCADIGGIIEVTVTVFDSTGTEDHCTSNVEIVDNIPPVIVCPGNIVISNSSDSCTANVTIPPATATDNCLIANLVNDFNNTPDPSGNYPIGVTSVTFTATDGSGNSVSCIFSVTVVDSTVVVDCNPDIVQNNDSGLCQAFVSVPPPTITTCSEDSISITNDISTGNNASGVYPVGNTTVTWTISGGSVATETCIQNMEIIDAEAPIVICKDFVLELNPQGEATLNAVDIIESANDNCGVSSSELDKTDFNLDDLGENTVTVTVEDLSENSAACLSSVIVTGSEPPIAICNNITAMLDENGFAEIDAAEIGNGSSSNNGIASMVPNPDILTCADIGTNSITLTVTDALGLSSTCTAEVTIIDTLAPTILCKNASMTENNFWDANYALNAVNGGFEDNCSITGYTLIRNSNDDGSEPVPATSITVIATDLSGNKSTCDARVSIIDQDCNTLFTLSPNPTSGEFYLTNNGIDGKYQVELIDNLGKIVYRDYFELVEHESITINPYQLRAGIYVVKLINVDKSCYHTSRLVIQR